MPDIVHWNHCYDSSDRLNIVFMRSCTIKIRNILLLMYEIWGSHDNEDVDVDLLVCNTLRTSSYEPCTLSDWESSDYFNFGCSLLSLRTTVWIKLQLILIK